MKVLSLFDGMSCGMLALQKAEIPVESYDAYEIDKYAIQAATHNFPQIIEHGDVFQADFTQYKDVDLIVGGSPCTYWSIAQKNNRETEASGIGWELFSQYVRAVKEAAPRFFIYENNKSMSDAIRKSITQTFGFEPICINSALVSAQNRQRLYWVGKRTADGTYRKVPVDQPQDKGILLKDILDGITDREKGRAVIGSAGRTTTREYFDKNQGNMSYEPMIYQVPHGFNDGGIKYDKSPTLIANGSWQCNNYISEPVGIAQRGRYVESRSRSSKCGGGTEQYFEARTDGKSNCVSTVQKDSMVAEPVCVQEQLNGRKANCDGSYDRRYEARTDSKTGTLTTNNRQNSIAEPVRVGAMPRPNGELSTSQSFRVYSTQGKSVNITAGGGGAGGKTGLYAIPINTTNSEKSQCLRATYYKDGIRNLIGNDVDKRTAVAIPIEFDNGVPTKAISCAGGKTYTVYEVKSGLITIKSKQYPIKFADGYYIIRKLTVSECKRLQTVPEWYEFPVSDTQAYKMLGNGWTIDVIVHLLKAVLASESTDLEAEFYTDADGQLSWL